MTEEVRDLLTVAAPGEQTEGAAPAVPAEAPAEAPQEAEAAVTPAGLRGDTPPAMAEAPDYRSHLAALAAQGEALRAELPGFSLREALTDPDFVRMTSPAVGLSVRRAWYALHEDELRREAAERSALALTESLASGALRPREGGRGLAAGALGASDPRSWSPEKRAELRRRVAEAAARGEKIYP